MSDINGSSDSSSDLHDTSPCATSVSTPFASLSSSGCDGGSILSNLKQYIALGCLHFNQPLPLRFERDGRGSDWMELVFATLPDEIRLIVGNEAARLLEAGWIRMFLHDPQNMDIHASSIVRVYLLPEDWGRRFIDRRSKSLKSALRDLLHCIDVSPIAWHGKNPGAHVQYFDPWASAEDVSLYYLFNKLSSPNPTPDRIKDRYTKYCVLHPLVVEDLLDSSSSFPSDEYDSQALYGLRTRLYPYQARSASLMIQREAAPQLQLDPRLEVRRGPDGQTFFFGARDGSILQEPRYYEANRGGILAETMGLGKTIICLAVVLATKGSLPLIPPIYQTPPRVRPRTGSLAEIAADIIGRNSIPAVAHLRRLEEAEGIDMSSCRRHLEQAHPSYEIPIEVSRMNRTTKIPPPQKLILCSATIIVVPRNLLQQWKNEIRKHLLQGALKILIMDTISKRAPRDTSQALELDMDFRSELPPASELMQYDLVLFTRNRFEQEVQDGTEGSGRSVIREGSPLKQLHWLRIVIDEGHSFSGGLSNAVLIAKELQIDRRWVVSGTPAKDLVGVEVDVSSLEAEEEVTAVRNSTIAQRKAFSLKDDTSGAAKALGALASNFLMVRPWCDAEGESRLLWEDYIYRHEHQYRKTYSGFSSCFLRILEGMVVKTRPEDVERDITLPPMRHRTVFLKPCWFDKMTANMFIQVLRANAITSERSDVDYLFHKNSVKARQSLIRNLRQSNFTWTGFSIEDVANSLETSSKYLQKKDKTCSLEDAEQLLESSEIIARLLHSKAWCALGKTHEVGMAVSNWPQESEETFALAYPEKPTMVGVTQLLEAQSHVDSRILSSDPCQGLDAVGQYEKAKIAQLEAAEEALKSKKAKASEDSQLSKAGVPSSCTGGQPLTSRRTAVVASKTSLVKRKSSAMTGQDKVTEDIIQLEVVVEQSSPPRPKKRKVTLQDEMAQLSETSPLQNTLIVGTTSAKLSYLLEMVVKHQATEKIIIFYDGDNAAYYIAQCLETLYINHRIYARSLDNIKRSQYVTLFHEDPDLRVLLIDVACGALGLNLNAASIILIVNPINRPGIEAQAIKRAHRIGQTKEVLVETLVLEGTIEEAIFNRAKKMSRNEHMEAKMLEDDTKIIDIIQNAKVIAIDPEESSGLAQFAPLQAPQQIFGRAGREKYHRFGHVEAKSPQKLGKRARATKTPSQIDEGLETASSSTTIPLLLRPPPLPTSADSRDDMPSSSIFGGLQDIVPEPEQYLLPSVSTILNI